MASGKTIKGITVEIGGSTTGLGKALSEANAKLKDTQSELNKVDKALKLDPNNVTLVKQKQELLTKAISDTSSKLDTLKKSQKQVEDQFKSGKIGEEAYRDFQRELETTKAKLENLKDEKKSINVISTAFDSAKSKVSDFAVTVKKPINAIGLVTKAAKKSAEAIGKAATAAGKMAVSVGKIPVKTVQAGTKAFSAYGKAAAGAATAVTGALLANVEASREWNNDMLKLETNAKTSGNSFELMKSKMSDLTAITGESDSSIEALSNLMAIGLTDEQMTPTINALSGAVEKFPDTLKIESLADSLQETIATGSATGQFSELIGRMGGDVEAFNGELAGCTTEAEKQQVALNWLANSGLSEINKEYQKANKSTIDYEKASFNLQDTLANLGTTFTPVMSNLKNIGTQLLENATPGLTVFAESMSTTLGNVMSADSLSEMIVAIVDGLAANLPTALSGFNNFILQIVNGIVTSLPTMIHTILPTLITGFTDLVTGLVQYVPTVLPLLVEGGITLFTGLLDSLNQIVDLLMPQLPEIVKKISEMLVENLPTIIEGGMQLLIGLIDGITECIPDLIQCVLGLIPVITDTLVENLPQLIKAGMDLITALAKGLPDAIPAIVAALPEIIKAIIDGFAEVDWLEIGINILEGIAAGLVEAVKGIGSVIADVGSSIKDGFCSFFGINSPSRLFRDTIGKNLAAGIGVGFEDEMTDVNAAMQAAVPTSFDTDVNINRNLSNSGSALGFSAANSLPQTASFYIIMDGQTVANKTAPFLDILNGAKVSFADRGLST